MTAPLSAASASPTRAGGVSELHRLYVLADAGKDGLGQALVQWVVDQAQANGARKLTLYSDVHLEDAHRLYLRMGFHCTVFRYAPDPWQSREWAFELSLL